LDASDEACAEYMFSFIEITNREENMPGWRGTILRIDLTAERITKQPLDSLVARNFIGARLPCLKR